MTLPLDFGGAARAGAVVGRTEFADRLGPQYRVVVTTRRLLSAHELPQLGRDQAQRVTLTTVLRDDDRDAAGRLRYRIDLFDQRLPFTRQLLGSFRLRDDDYERTRGLVDGLAAAIAAGAVDPGEADLTALSEC